MQDKSVTPGTPRDTNPGDQARPGPAGTGENSCPHCGGKGKHSNASKCPVCGGTGKVIVGVGGA